MTTCHGLEPIGQRNHRVVIYQRNTNPAGDGLIGGHCRNHQDPHAQKLFHLSQNDGGYREHSRITLGHHCHRVALLGQRARE